MLRIDIQSAPSLVTLVCAGRIVLGVEAETLRCVTTARLEREVRLDLSRVNMIDAAGLGLLVELHRWALRRSASLTIASPSLQAHRMFTLTNLDRVFNLAGLPGDMAAARGSRDWGVMTA